METYAAKDNRINSYVNHVSHIQNIPNPDQIQYMNFSHCVAWSFSKDKKCKKKNLIIIIKKFSKT